MKLWVKNSYNYYSLDDDKQKKLYEVFKDSYVKSTGASFSESDFDWRAKNWTFFGVAPDTDGRQCGGIAVRVQRSGMVKLVASFGNVRGMLDGLKELESEMGDKPIWGFMEPNMVSMLKRADANFVELPPKVVKTIVEVMAKSGTIPGFVKANNDGSVTFDTPSGQMNKYYVCNKNYVDWLLNSIQNSDNIPVPKLLRKPIVALLKNVIKK